ncbi:MAG: inositol-3-phosphate synthase, partial [Acidobacteria bacterium]|nr:inositol-3-phosphate synthase [Acidobacteriota bacterium]
MSEKRIKIAAPTGKMGVLLIGLGAVSTTFIAGVEAIKKGLGKPIGSLTQMGTVRLGKRTEKRIPKIAEVVPLAGMDDLVFAAWDIFEDDAYAAATNSGVLEASLLQEVKTELEAIRPRKAVFDPRYVTRLHGTHLKKGKTKWDLAQQLVD